MSRRLEHPDCLNCGAPLTGPFCSQCGQRSIPPYPSVVEVAGDAWHQFSGYDGRFVTTITRLLRKPGALTLDWVEGRRARYISPVRLYLVASLVYFVVGAAAPNVRVQDPQSGNARDIKIGLWTPKEEITLTPEERAQAEAQLADAPPLLKPLLTSVMRDPVTFQQRMLRVMPRVLFALVPVFAGILALFYWRHPYSQHLIFALHLHAVIFLGLAIAELPKFTGSLTLSLIIGLAAVAFIALYALRGLHHVYRSGWLATLIKAPGIAAVYIVVWLPVMLLMMAWAAFAAR